MKNRKNISTQTQNDTISVSTQTDIVTQSSDVSSSPDVFTQYLELSSLSSKEVDNDDDHVKEEEFFTNGEAIGLEESRNVEFKLCEYGNTQTITRYCCSYVCAFLNSDGGTLYFGVEEPDVSGKGSIVVGMQNMNTEKKRDLVKGQIVTSLLQMRPAVNCVSPRVDIEFIPVLSTDRFVLRVRVESQGMREGRLYSTSNKSYVRTIMACEHNTTNDHELDQRAIPPPQHGRSFSYLLCLGLFSFLLAPRIYSNRTMLLEAFRKYGLVLALYLKQRVMLMGSCVSLLSSSSSSSS